MNLNRLADQLHDRLQQPLPGKTAHEPMRATPVGSLIPAFDHKTPPKPGSVLILLYESDQTIKFPLIKRPDYLGAHGGQISLPGGKAELNENYIQTALRECEEEIGVPSMGIKVIGKLSEFFVIPSNFMVAPVVAYTTCQPVFHPQQSEVERVLQADISQLLSEDAIQTKEILAAKRYPMQAPHFIVEGEIVWGATAMMLNELRMIVRELAGK
ncbi:MAG: CoA pyrophosphatase [Bacteroidetes bacterium]|nr:CoA pyrophosphatase [Bacteroidota bacterium]MBS1539710.1 CoA pyrophosphatase [Bacteroidota bacterium]